MTTSLLARVKSKLFIPSQRRAVSILEGEYRSLDFGRSTDFEDLRQYEPGDDIKDIDWKATARSTAPLVRRYIASRRHTIMLVADTGRNMQAISPSGETKSDLATLALGVMGYLSVRHADSVSALYGDSLSTRTIPPKSTESHLERILQAVTYESAKTNNAPSGIMKQLLYINAHFRQRMIIVIAADEFEVNEENLSLMRILRAKHDLLWLSISDADPISQLALKNPVFDVLDGYQIPDFIKRDTSLIEDFAEEEVQRKMEMNFALDGLRIPRTELTESSYVISSLISLLERRRRQRAF